MRIEELELVCCQAARELAQRGDRPVPTAVVLPLPHATRVVTLEGFPDADPARFDVLEQFAREEMRLAEAPAYGFVAEAAAPDDDGQPVEVVVVVYGARGHHPRVLAAPLTGSEVGPFGQAEELEPTALPFLSPLQHAADAVPAG